jgi:low affinity Fe/Cu permease
MRDLFRRVAERTAHAVGSPWAFLVALLTISVWGVTGPYFRYSDTWQLLINTGTTIVTFLMVFLIQNTQNRETRIVTLKLDELLRGVEGARTGLVQLDHMSDAELEGISPAAREVCAAGRRRPRARAARAEGAQAQTLRAARTKAWRSGG